MPQVCRVCGNSVKGAASELNADGPTGGILESFLDYRTANRRKMQGWNRLVFHCFWESGRANSKEPAASIAKPQVLLFAISVFFLRRVFRPRCGSNRPSFPQMRRETFQLVLEVHIAREGGWAGDERVGSGTAWAGAPPMGRDPAGREGASRSAIYGRGPSRSDAAKSGFPPAAATFNRKIFPFSEAKNADLDGLPLQVVRRVVYVAVLAISRDMYEAGAPSSRATTRQITMMAVTLPP